MTNLLSLYQLGISLKHYQEDAAQFKVIKQIEALYTQLLMQQKRISILPLFKKKSRVFPNGIYLWGSVGRGKTLILDLFYQTIPNKEKKRLHFHRFMKFIHQQLQKHQGRKNPLQYIIQQFSKNLRVLCLDEFLVTDITDAMLLAEILKHLLQQNIFLVTTGNSAPDQLYQNGLQRDRFLPAIELIKTKYVVIAIEGNDDHRQRVLKKAKSWLWPLTQENQTYIQDLFNHLTTDPSNREQTLNINERSLDTIAFDSNVVWLNFSVLCEQARSVSDYIELTNLFHTLIITQIPQLNADKDDAAKRFMHLIDECYDRRVKIFITSAVALDELYQGTLLQEPFQRTKSRLIEMQSQAYLEDAHICSLTAHEEH